MSPRRRKDPADAWMPPRVYRGKSAYEYHPPDGDHGCRRRPAIQRAPDREHGAALQRGAHQVTESLRVSACV